MAIERASAPGRTVPRGRCRCGHYPSQHMLVRALPGAASFRLDAGGPCALCGAESCRGYVPASSA